MSEERPTAREIAKVKSYLAKADKTRARMPHYSADEFVVMAIAWNPTIKHFVAALIPRSSFEVNKMRRTDKWDMREAMNEGFMLDMGSSALVYVPLSAVGGITIKPLDVIKLQLMPIETTQKK